MSIARPSPWLNFIDCLMRGILWMGVFSLGSIALLAQAQNYPDKPI